MIASYIYGIRSKAHGNKIVYVGKCLSRPLSQRMECQFNDALRYNRKGRLCVAIRKYGKTNFKYVVLEVVTNPKILSDREKKYIKTYSTYKSGYNMTKGGDGGRDTKNVAKYDNFGKLVATYSSVYEASTLNKVFPSNISMCANEYRCPRLKGFRYRYFNLSPMKQIKPYVHPLKGRKRGSIA